MFPGRVEERKQSRPSDRKDRLDSEVIKIKAKSCRSVTQIIVTD